MNRQKNSMQNMYSEIAAKFGITKQFRKDEELPHPVDYVIAAKVGERDQQPLDANTVLHEFIDERGRIIRKGHSGPVDSIQWLKQWHPEILTHDDNVVVNTDDLSGDSTIFFSC